MRSIIVCLSLLICSVRIGSHRKNQHSNSDRGLSFFFLQDLVLLHLSLPVLNLLFRLHQRFSPLIFVRFPFRIGSWNQLNQYDVEYSKAESLCRRASWDGKLFAIRLLISFHAIYHVWFHHSTVTILQSIRPAVSALRTYSSSGKQVMFRMFLLSFIAHACSLYRSLFHGKMAYSYFDHLVLIILFVGVYLFWND